MDEPLNIVCVRANIGFTPVMGSVEGACEMCEATVLIAPDIQFVLANLPEDMQYMLLCVQCAALKMTQEQSQVRSYTRKEEVRRMIQRAIRPKDD